MPTSSSIDYALTARQIVEYAHKKTGLLARGEALDANMAADALTELNMMLKEWQKYPAIWRRTEGFVNLLSNTAAYNLSPRPFRVIDIRYRDTAGRDIPMIELTREDYYDLPDKTTNGIPTQWYFDPQRGTSAIYVWPVLLTANGETLRVTHQRRFEDVDDMAEEVDVDQEHLSTVAYNLAARIADDFGRTGAHIDRIIARAQMLFNEMVDSDRPEFIRFVPERRYG